MSATPTSPSEATGTAESAAHAEGSGSRRAWWILGVVLAGYAAAYAVYWPDVITVADEGNYVRQARMLVAGQTHLDKLDPFTGRILEIRTNWYPAGTAGLMTPWVAAFGWRGAYASSLLCLLAGVLGTAAWLRAARRPELFALLVMAFPAALVMGRIAMSDVPSLAVVAVGSWLFWRGIGAARGWWLAAGLLAGLSLSLREPNALLFAPFFAGAVLRRDRGWVWLLVGGLAGSAVRLGLSAWVYGDPFFYKPVAQAFHAGAIAQNAGMLALAMLVFVPGGALLAPFYRGPRRAEVVVACLLFPCFYLLYGYGASESGFAKRLVLSHRFLIPVLPLYAFALAEVVPRWWARVRTRVPGGPQAAARGAALAAGLAVAGIGTAAVAVHPLFHRLTRPQAEIREAIYTHTAEGGLVITNWFATGKYIDLTYGPRVPLDRANFSERTAPILMQRHQQVFIVLLDRSDSPYWREDARQNAELVGRVGPRAELVYDRTITATDRLRIWRVDRAPQAWRRW